MKLFRKLLSWPKKAESGSVSTQKPESESTSSQALQTESKSQQKDISLRSCNTIKYYSEFLPWLLGETELPENWKEIQSEFADLIKTPQSESIFQLYNKIEFFRNKISVLLGSKEFPGALDLLKVEYDKELAEIVMNNGYDLIEFSEDREQYLKAIYLIETECKSLIIYLNQYINEYNLLCPEGEQVRHDRAFYEREYSIISKYMGFRLHDATVAEFCGHKNLYFEELKHHENG